MTRRHAIEIYAAIACTEIKMTSRTMFRAIVARPLQHLAPAADSHHPRRLAERHGRHGDSIRGGKKMHTRFMAHHQQPKAGEQGNSTAITIWFKLSPFFHRAYAGRVVGYCNQASDVTYVPPAGTLLDIKGEHVRRKSHVAEESSIF